MRTEAGAILEDLHFSYRRGQEVLRGVDLMVPRGGIFALLGLNGAGKTTLLRLLMGMLRPTMGRVELLGHQAGSEPLPPALLARIGYVHERPFPSERSTARALLNLVRTVHPRWDEATVRRCLELFNLPLDTPCKNLSAGTKSQLALTLAMAGQPELLILDEPTLGLDPLHRHQYLQFLLREALENDLTIILTSHDLYQIERMAETIAIIHDGIIAVQKPLDELKEGVKRIRVGAGTSADIAPRLAAVPGVIDVRAEDGGYLLSSVETTEETVAELRGLPGVNGLQILDLSLEEIFLTYCGSPQMYL